MRAEFEIDGSPFIFRGLDDVVEDTAERRARLTIVAKDLDRVKQSA